MPALLIALALLLAACGDDDDNGNGGNGGETPPAGGGEETPLPGGGALTAEVTLVNTAFNPPQIEVEAGTTVTWINADTTAHTVTAGTRDAPTGLFDSGNLDPGGTFSFTFTEPGTYDYFCTPHDGMDGTVVVTESSPSG
jgi:plastocyanin